MRKAISVIGLGKLGSPMVAVFASKGFRVIGVDKDYEKVRKLRARVAPVDEPGLGQLLRLTDIGQPICNIEATINTKGAVLDTDATFVIVPTPSKSDGSFSLEYAIAACKEIGEALKEKKTFHLVVITSTVLPGGTKALGKVLEETSGKKMGRDFGLCYSPEFIALGSVIRDLQNPDMILIGQSDMLSGDILEKILGQVTSFRPPFFRTNFTNAELTKIAINTFITTKIAFANMLSEICTTMVGGDVDVVTCAVGTDSRIGSKYLRGGGSYGGPCFPRDNRALAFLALCHGVDPKIPRATDEQNLAHVRFVADLVDTHMALALSRVGIFGLTYKPGTNVTEESFGSKLEEELSDRGYDVFSSDPEVPLSDGQDSVLNCSVIIFATPHEAYTTLPAELFFGKTVIDPWRRFEHLKVEGVKYIGVGLGESR